MLIQTVQGYAIYQSVDERYEKVALAADFVLWHYQVIGKRVGIYDPRFYRNGQSFLFEYMEKKQE